METVWDTRFGVDRSMLVSSSSCRIWCILYGSSPLMYVLDYASDIASVLGEHVSGQRHTGPEWIVIVLITMKVNSGFWDKMEIEEGERGQAGEREANPALDRSGRSD